MRFSSSAWRAYICAEQLNRFKHACVKQLSGSGVVLEAFLLTRDCKIRDLFLISVVWFGKDDGYSLKWDGNLLVLV